MTQSNVAVLQVRPFEQRQEGGLVRVPDGEYDLAFIAWETKSIFKVGKLYLHFRVVTQGPNFGLELPAYFIVKPRGKLGKRGGFYAGPKSAFARTFGQLFGWGGRGDRFPMTRFEHVVLVGRTKTVTLGADHQKLPEVCRYSKVAQLLRVKEL